MAQPYPLTTTLSTATTSTALILDPTARYTQATINWGTLAASTGSGTTDITLQATLDTWSPTAVSSVVWNNVSSVHYSSASASAADGYVVTFTQPLAGLRLSSSTWAGGTATVTLKVLQSIGW